MKTPDLLCFCHLRWNFVFQRPQHLMLRWARQHRVFFFEEPLYDAQTPALCVTADPSGVLVVTPHLPARSDDEPRILRGLVDELVRERRIDDFVCWYYTPMAVSFSRQLAPRAVVYDCMDELSHFQGAPPELVERERELLRRADVVFTGGHHLYEAKKSLHANVHPFPSGVDVPHFAAARSMEVDPEDQAPIARPRLGFYGVTLASRLMGVRRAQLLSPLQEQV